MIYYTGDIHGETYHITQFCRRFRPTREDTIIILGDVGANFYGGGRDTRTKFELSLVQPTILCIHGNHEMRPVTITSYKEKQWNGGTVWYEEEYPNLLFAKDGEIYDIEDLRHLVIGGAYSVDKFYRLQRGYGWWPDEQPSAEIKARVESQIRTQPFDIVLSHTCPFRYEPVDTFLTSIDQSTVDTSTERWLGELESSMDYKAWFCGHWHIDRRVDRMHFLFHSFEASDQFHAPYPAEDEM